MGGAYRGAGGALWAGAGLMVAQCAGEEEFARTMKDCNWNLQGEGRVSG
jgi:hypothetical protein